MIVLTKPNIIITQALVNGQQGSFTSAKSFEELVPDIKKANKVSCFVAEVQKYIDTALLL